MKTLSKLKTLPLIALLASGLVLAPVVSMADSDRGRGKDRVYQKYDSGKGHYRDHGRAHRKDHGHKKVYRQPGHKHVYNSHYKHGHKHHAYKHPGRGHKHVDHVIVHDHYYDYDPFRLMLGLHFDNVDIIYRDF